MATRSTTHRFIMSARDNTDAATTSAGNNFKKLSKRAATVATTVTTIGTAVGGVGLAVAKMSADSAREMDNLARAANATTAEFEATATAARKYNIEQDELSDILRDVTDRVGDFISTGAGPMADFFEQIAPLVGVTAEQFSRLSGPEAMQLYVNSLEQANLSQSEMVFFMEAIASNSSNLLPLYANNGRELQQLTDRYHQFNDSLQLSSGQTEDLSELSKTFDLIGTTAGNAAERLTATLAPELNGFLNMALELIPKTTNALVDFINTFRDADNISAISDLEEEIDEVSQKIVKAEERLNSVFGRTITGREEYSNQLLLYRTRLEELNMALRALTEQEQARQGQTGGNNTGDSDTPNRQQTEEDVTLAIAEFELKTFKEIQEEKEMRHLNSLQMQLVAEQEHQRKQIELQEELDAKRRDAALGLTNSLGDLFVQQADLKYQAELDALRNSENLTEKEREQREEAAREAFENSKRLQLGLVGVNTAAAVMNELATNPDPWSKWLTVGSIVALGLKQASAINAQKFGGGTSIAGANTPAGATQTPTPLPPGGSQPQQSVNINITTTGNNDPQEIIQALQDFYNNDGVLFNQDSAQYQQVVNG